MMKQLKLSSLLCAVLMLVTASGCCQLTQTKKIAAKKVTYSTSFEAGHMPSNFDEERKDDNFLLPNGIKNK